MFCVDQLEIYGVLVWQRKYTFIFGGKIGFLEKLSTFREEPCVKEGVLGFYREHKFISSDTFSKGFLCASWYFLWYMQRIKLSLCPKRRHEGGVYI
jgi:hypothetical protein